MNDSGARRLAICWHSGRLVAWSSVRLLVWYTSRLVVWSLSCLLPGRPVSCRRPVTSLPAILSGWSVGRVGAIFQPGAAHGRPDIGPCISPARTSPDGPGPAGGRSSGWLGPLTRPLPDGDPTAPGAGRLTLAERCRAVPSGPSGTGTGRAVPSGAERCRDGPAVFALSARLQVFSVMGWL